MALSEALAQLNYPCNYPFKFFCRPAPETIIAIRDTIARSAPDWDPEELVQRPSRTGRFVALTATIQARDAAQIETIYLQLAAVDGILMSI